MKTCCVIIADDHNLFRQGLKKLLEEDQDIEVVGEAGDGIELLDLLKVVVPHLIILDISMPNLRGIEAISEIKKQHPDTKILMLTMYRDKEYLYQSIFAGADGYLLKKDVDREFFSAIEKIRRGKIYVSPHLSGELADDWESIRRGFHPALTTREIEILKLIAEGKSNKEIGSIFFMSVHTVERHRSNILSKLGLKGTADLVRYAIQKGYVE